MTFVPTTTVDVWRDTDSDDENVFGDPTETGSTPLYTGVPASVVMSGFSRSTLTDLSEDRVLTYTVRVAQRWGIREGDRLRDNRVDRQYVVAETSYPPSLVGQPSARLVCTRVGVDTP